MSSSATQSNIVPAALSYLAVYNPSLIQTNGSAHDQIVYQFSKPTPSKTDRNAWEDAEKGDREEEHMGRLRQIGLVRGMVDFAKNFSNGEALDAIETEKSRILLHELESGWWILAVCLFYHYFVAGLIKFKCIDLSRLLSSADVSASVSGSQQSNRVEYSAREVSPTPLLREQVIRAHKIFLLHHGPTLSELLSRLQRPKFCKVLKRFWDAFACDWDVLLHGNPAVDICNGLKLAAGGELGIGVGEEEWGSGEREVLEGFIARTEGLVDMVVSRFTDFLSLDAAGGPQKEPTCDDQSSKSDMRNWRGSGHDPLPSDGIIFSGIGAISRSSVQSISYWLESLFRYGRDAYGVGNNPASATRQKRTRSHRKVREADLGRKGQPSIPGSTLRTAESSSAPQIPPPILRPRGNILGAGIGPVDPQPVNAVSDQQRYKQPSTEPGPASGAETLMKYMTLGIYGSRKDSSSKASTNSSQKTYRSIAMDHSDASKEGDGRDSGKVRSSSDGFFLIGLQGNLEESAFDDGSQVVGNHSDQENSMVRQLHDRRIMLRTIQIERGRHQGSQSLHGTPKTSLSEVPTANSEKLQIIIYIHQPFVFAFFFELHTDSLAMPAFYGSLHHQLGPLQRPLLKSTAPDKVSQRLKEAVSPRSTAWTQSSQPIYNLVYDPDSLTVHTNLPNIPEPKDAKSAVGTAPWTRVEALTIHSQILSVFGLTRCRESDMERTCKTTRGWWVVWMRLPHHAASQRLQRRVFREAFLIRKATDYSGPGVKGSGGRWRPGGLSVENGASSTDGRETGKLAEGIGIDARHYIESLVGLNR
ncbi:MAG: hypothetical protein Q9167_003753 [Letrouitia subvulpina]